VRNASWVADARGAPAGIKPNNRPEIIAVAKAKSSAPDVHGELRRAAAIYWAAATSARMATYASPKPAVPLRSELPGSLFNTCRTSRRSRHQRGADRHFTERALREPTSISKLTHMIRTPCRWKPATAAGHGGDPDTICSCKNVRSGANPRLGSPFFG